MGFGPKPARAVSSPRGAELLLWLPETNLICPPSGVPSLTASELVTLAL